jgi:hypothetical protein
MVSKISQPDDTSFRPIVSVIVATYNHEPFIAQAIQSVVDQATTFSFEIIVTEDKSTDGTLDVAISYQNTFPDLITIIYSDDNLNNSDVFVRAIKHASGKYIAYLDGDDYWTSTEKLQRQFEFLETYPDCALVHHAVERVSEDGVPIRTLDGFASRATIEDLIQGNPIASCSVMIRRSAIVPVPGWFGLLKAGDWTIYIIAAQHGWVGRIEGTLGHYRIHSSASWATTPVAMQWATSLAMLDEMEKHLDPRYRPAFVRSRSHMIQELSAAIALQASLQTDDVSIYERETLAKQMIAQAEHDIASVADRKGRLFEELAESQSKIIEVQSTIIEVQSHFSEREVHLSQERQTLLQLLDDSHRQSSEREARLSQALDEAGQQASEREARLSQERQTLLHLLRKEQRITRRVAVTGAAISTAFATALIISLWLH